MTFADKIKLFDSTIESNILIDHDFFMSDKPVTGRDRGMYYAGKFVAYYEMIQILDLKEDFISYCEMKENECEDLK